MKPLQSASVLTATQSFTCLGVSVGSCCSILYLTFVFKLPLLPPSALCSGFVFNLLLLDRQAGHKGRLYLVFYS